MPVPLYRPPAQLPLINPLTLEKPLRCLIFSESSLAKRVWEYAHDEEVSAALHNLIHGNVWSRLGTGPLEPPGTYGEFFLSVFSLYKTNYCTDSQDGVGKHSAQMQRLAHLQEKMHHNAGVLKSVDPMNALYNRACSELYGDLDTTFYDDMHEALQEVYADEAGNLLTPVCELVGNVTSHMEAFFMYGLEDSSSVPVFMCIQNDNLLVYVP